MTKIKSTNVRPGMLIVKGGAILRIVKLEHVKPGKGPAYIQATMKDIIKGNKLEERLRTSDTVERANLDVTKHQFLYQKGDEYHFMNVETYEQETLTDGIVAEKVQYLSEGMEVEIEFLNGEAVNLILPVQIPMKIKETEPVVKGQTAASSLKNATLENGIVIQVPPHIKEGDTIILDVENNSYVKKV